MNLKRNQSVKRSSILITKYYTKFFKKRNVTKYNQEIMFISIILGLAIWIALPQFLNSRIKNKSDRKAVAVLCKIVGIAISVYGIFNYITIKNII